MLRPRSCNGRKVSKESETEPVIKLPRGRGLRLSGPELFRVALTLAMLIAVVVLTKPCSNAVSTFVMGMDESEQGTAVRKPGTVEPGPQSGGPPTEDPQEPAGSDEELDAPSKPDDRFERLRPGMTEAEVRSAIERAKAKAEPPPKPSARALE